MNKQALVDSIAYCGLVCGRCHLRAECDFCKNAASLCARSEVCCQIAGYEMAILASGGR
jgi:hypothetical protein